MPNIAMRSPRVHIWPRAVLTLLLAAGLIPLWTLAQAPVGFEAASVHLTNPDNVGCQYFWPDPGHFRTINATLKCLVRAGYGIEDYQIRGAEGWIATQGFDIEAAAVPPAGDSSRRQALIQDLLANRFQLRVHTDKKEVAGLVLTVAKGGPKLHEVAARGPGVSLRAGRTNGRGADIETLARVLSTHLERPVRDETGLRGYYDFSMTWAPLDTAAQDEPAPDLLAALQDQLGLRLEKGRAEVEIITIDHAEKPGGN